MRFAVKPRWSLLRSANPAMPRSPDGALFNLTGTGSGVFDRLSAELSGYYLLGVEAEASDRNGKPHPIRVDVARNNVNIRAHRMMIAGGGTDTAAAAARTPQQIVTAA